MAGKYSMNILACKIFMDFQVLFIGTSTKEVIKCLFSIYFLEVINCWVTKGRHYFAQYDLLDPQINSQQSFVAMNSS